MRWAKAEKSAWRVSQASECLLDENCLAAAIEAERGADAGRVTGELSEARRNGTHFLYAHYGSPPE